MRRALLVLGTVGMFLAPRVAVAAAPLTLGYPAVPIHQLTPGADDGSLSQIDVCEYPGVDWIAPLTTAQKEAVLHRYGIPWSEHAKYVVDHLIAVNVGGTDDIKNLWPQRATGKFGVKVKDALETKLWKAVCSGRYSLRNVQHAEATGWTKATAVLAKTPRAGTPIDTKPVIKPPTKTQPPVTAPPVVVPTVPAPAPIPVPPVVVPPAPVGFGDGTHLISQMPAGQYMAPGGSGCYWSRLSDLSGELSGIVANDFGHSHLIVAIAATDAAFKTDGCGTWTLYQPMGAAVTSFGDGTFAVNSDIVAGLYSAAGGSGCYWARLGGFGGQIADIITNDFGPTGPYVSISATDLGFQSDGCGAWIKVG